MKIAKKFILKAGSQLNDERDTQMQEVTYLKEKLGGRGGEFGIPQSKKCSWKIKTQKLGYIDEEVSVISKNL